MYVGVSKIYSPNFKNKKRNKKKIKYLIYHYTGMHSESKAIDRLTDFNSKVSCHYFIKRNGSVILIVPELYEAWHAGKSNWKEDKSLNKYSIGIEISNKGHQLGYQNFTKKQINCLLNLSKYLIRKYNIKKKNILGHSDIAFKRKKDPGEKFPWKYLSNHGIGIWHKLSNTQLKQLRKNITSKKQVADFFNYLNKIGYFTKVKSSLNKKMLVKSFQMRFRQDLINGKIDQECLFIAKNLSKII